jgi:hypothetical protein
LDSLLRFRPRQCGLKGGDGREESVGGRQRDLVDEILRSGDGTSVERGNPARERVDETIQLGVRKCPVDVSVSFCGSAIEVGFAVERGAIHREFPDVASHEFVVVLAYYMLTSIDVRLGYKIQ